MLAKGFGGHKKILGRKRQLLVETGGLLVAPRWPGPRK
jgi:hypothetical protein